MWEQNLWYSIACRCWMLPASSRPISNVPSTMCRRSFFPSPQSLPNHCQCQYPDSPPSTTRKCLPWSPHRLRPPTQHPHTPAQPTVACPSHPSPHWPRRPSPTIILPPSRLSWSPIVSSPSHSLIWVASEKGAQFPSCATGHRSLWYGNFVWWWRIWAHFCWTQALPLPSTPSVGRKENLCLLGTDSASSRRQARRYPEDLCELDRTCGKSDQSKSKMFDQDI